MTKHNLKINCGTEYLIPKSDWVDPDELYGEYKVLTSPIIEQAFNKILDDFIPQHNIAFLSLCTTTRPYNKSQKWKTFVQEFSNSCDLIVCSNGGIIPQKYWECYPFLTYDAPHLNEDFTEDYIKFQYEHLVKFFSKFTSYDKIIFNFRPTLRNRVAVNQFLETDIATQFDCHVLPSEEVFNKAKARGFNRGLMVPDLDDYVMDELREHIGIAQIKKQCLW